MPTLNGDIAHLLKTSARINHFTMLNEDVHASFPATIDITAMRIAMPNVTCRRITL